MAIIARTLAFIKSDPLLLLGGAARVDECFASVGHVWRERVLTPAVTMKLFILQVLHGNTAISALRHLANIDVADSSYCDARRARLPLAGVAAAVSQLCCEGGRSIENAAAWLGRRRVMMTDATSVTTPDTPALQKLWPQPHPHKAGCGFPAIKLPCLLDLATGMIMQVTMMCMDVHEMSQLAGPHAGLRRGDVLLGLRRAQSSRDRAFCSFAHLVLLVAMSVDAVVRTHQAQIIDYTPNRPHRRRKGEKNKGDRGKGRGYEKGLLTSRFVRRLAKEDQVVEWRRPANQPTWMSAADYAALPQTLEVRELRYRIARPAGCARGRWTSRRRCSTRCVTPSTRSRGSTDCAGRSRRTSAT